jgi:hypothetical protein
MVDALRHTRFVEQVLRVGDRFPDLALPNTEGELVAIAGLLRRGPLVATFFRSEWCPYCRVTLNALAAALPEFQMAGAGLVAITPETGGRALRAKPSSGRQWRRVPRAAPRRRPSPRRRPKDRVASSQLVLPFPAGGQRNGGAEDVVGIVAPLGSDQPFGIGAIAFRHTPRIVRDE